MDNENKKPEPPVEVEEGATPPAELLLTEVAPAPIEPPKDSKPHTKRFDIKVPAGFVLPMGETVRDGFNLVVEAGVRWHPEWDSPKVTVNAYRFFYHGDALCWSGKRTLAFQSLLPTNVATLAEFHGLAVDEQSAKLLEAMGLTPPAEKQAMADFILPEQMGKRHH